LNSATSANKSTRNERKRKKSGIFLAA
jgi:hypothetical protein